MTRFILVDLNPDEHSPRLHYYPFMVSLDGCNGSCNIPVMSLTPPSRPFLKVILKLKLNYIFIFTPFCGPSKGFAEPQRSVKTKIQLNFFSSSEIRTRRDNMITRLNESKNIEAYFMWL